MHMAIVAVRVVDVAVGNTGGGSACASTSARTSTSNDITATSDSLLGSTTSN